MGSETQSCNNYYSDVSSPTSNNSSSTNGTSTSTSASSNNNNSNNNNNNEQQSNSIMANYYQSNNSNNNNNNNSNRGGGGGQGGPPQDSNWNDRNNWNNFQNMNQQYQRFYSESQNYNNLMAAAASQQQQQQQHNHHQQQQQQSQQMHVIQAPSSAKRLYYSQGKTSNNKDICGEDKHKEDGDPWNVEAQAAFLGPNLWDKTLPYDTDLKVHQYADLDEFLSENGIPVDGLPGNHLGHSTSGAIGAHKSDSLGNHIGTGLSFGLGQVTTKRERSPSPSDCMSPDTMNPASPADSTFSMSSSRDFDPRTRAFSDEELKPQPMIKKSRKQFVPDEMKDDKYWARRRKNNMAAKRSRDARRMKENQIALRAGYLEKENMNLHREVEQLKLENQELRSRLSKYQDV